MIDPHAHMTARTTDDYEAMAQAGIVAVIEPAFWLGQMGTNVGTFIDYFSTITAFERFRAGQFGIRHYCTIGLNSKEANDERLAHARARNLAIRSGRIDSRASAAPADPDQVPQPPRPPRAARRPAPEGAPRCRWAEGSGARRG